MEPKQQSRKKFLWWGAAVVAAVTGSRFLKKQPVATGKEDKETVKMLTQDGRLVEIDKSLLAGGGKKISTDELKQWVNKKTAK